MKVIRRVALVVAFALLFASAINAQEKDSPCRVKVRILSFNWDNANEYQLDRLSADQMEWWLKDGQAKFPNICIVIEKGVADYLIAWTTTAETRKTTYTVPNASTTNANGTVTTSSGGFGTYSGTATTTTYEQQQSEWTTIFVNAFVHRMIGEVGERHHEKLPIFVSKNKGQWRWSKADKDGFVKAMEFINKQLK